MKRGAPRPGADMRGLHRLAQSGGTRPILYNASGRIPKVAIAGHKTDDKYFGRRNHPEITRK
jgi:hypothetical protein